MLRSIQSLLWSFIVGLKPYYNFCSLCVISLYTVFAILGIVSKCMCSAVTVRILLVCLHRITFCIVFMFYLVFIT